MSQIKRCPNCGAAVEPGVSYCPQCGNDLKSGEVNPPNAPSIDSTGNIARGRSRGAQEHLTLGLNIALSNPIVFVPTLLSGVIGLIISYLNSFNFLGVLSLISTVISFILGFASLDMSRDAYDKQALDIGSSISYVFGRFVPFLIASIFGALLAITIVFIPAVIMTFVIMVIDETGIMDAFGKAFKVLFADLGDVIIVLLVAVVGFFLFGYVPFVSTFLNSALIVVIGLAFIDIYVNYKSQ